MTIPKRPWSKWDGQFKDYTKNCVGCDFYREINTDVLCGWGVAFKYLIKSKKLRKCEVKNRTLSNYRGCYREHSIEYLDKIILELQNG